MILPIKVLEEAIKVRQDHLDLLKIRERSILQPGYYNPDTHLFVLADIENFETQIT